MLAKDVSLHILAKNEEDLLPKLLERMCTYVGEIIVTDTGSTDRTFERALKSGATVCHTTLDNGFGEARNVGLSFVTVPWVLQIDADEWPTDQLLSWLVNWTADLSSYSGIGGALIRRHNLVGNQPIGKNTFEWHPRLFRSGYRFIGWIHEHPDAPYKSFIKAPEDCLLLHYKTVARQQRQNAFYETFN